MVGRVLRKDGWHGKEHYEEDPWLCESYNQRITRSSVGHRILLKQQTTDIPN